MEKKKNDVCVGKEKKKAVVEGKWEAIGRENDLYRVAVDVWKGG